MEPGRAKNDGSVFKKAKGPVMINIAYFERLPLVGFSDSFLGRNSCHQPTPSTHAEMNLIAKTQRYLRTKKGKKASHDLSGHGALVSLSLAYKKKAGSWTLQNGHPCHHCARDLRRCGIMRVKFSDPAVRTSTGGLLHDLCLAEVSALSNARVSTGYRIIGHAAHPRLRLTSEATFHFIRTGRKLFELRKLSPFIESLRSGSRIDFIHGHLTSTQTIKRVRRHKNVAKALKKLGVCNVLPALSSIPCNRRLAEGISYYRSLYSKYGFDQMEVISLELA
jgi:ASC-1-like (ASCH) protein